MHQPTEESACGDNYRFGAILNPEGGLHPSNLAILVQKSDNLGLDEVEIRLLLANVLGA